MRRPHLAAMLHDLAVGLLGLEVEPGVRVDELDARERRLRIADVLSQLEGAGAVVREGGYGERDECGDERGANHSGVPHDAEATALAPHGSRIARVSDWEGKAAEP